jgi:hypothetical protein
MMRPSFRESGKVPGWVSYYFVVRRCSHDVQVFNADILFSFGTYNPFVEFLVNGQHQPWPFSRHNSCCCPHHWMTRMMLHIPQHWTTMMMLHFPHHLMMKTMAMMRMSNSQMKSLTILKTTSLAAPLVLLVSALCSCGLSPLPLLPALADVDSFSSCCFSYPSIPYKISNGTSRNSEKSIPYRKRCSR